ncbi:hypothetical protein E4U55_002937 [Claviceps digitariae]|nr:hypothetical protein E4U55_002937 [Claviceps digitariae]
MPREDRATLLRPPPPDPSKAPIENVLEVTEVGVLGKDLFTNTRKAWTPPAARGIYGGTVIAQCLAAAQKTVDDDFVPHSCHCYFLLAGSSSLPILMHVERVRDGRSFATRTVQARQRGRCIFTTTISFVRSSSSADADTPSVHHAAPLPPGAHSPPPADYDDADGPAWARGGPFQHVPMPMPPLDSDPQPHLLRCQQWMRCRGTISPAGGLPAHLNALAYISDSAFLGTVIRVHHLWRLPFPPQQYHALPDDQKRQVEHLAQHDGLGHSPDAWALRPRLGMMVSLDHSIYFHAPRRVKVDEWMFADMDSSWAGDGRGFVTQRIFAADGTLLATCVQEGVVRLARPVESANL